MPRRPRPRWDQVRGRWISRIGPPGKDGRSAQVLFPMSLGQKDEAKAFEWMTAYTSRRADLAAPLETGTVAEVVERFLDHEERRQAAGELFGNPMGRYVIHLGFLVGPLGSRQIASVERRELQKIVDNVARTYSPVYTRHIASSIGRVFKWARDETIIAVNPAQGGLKTPTVPRSAERFAERSEAAAWLLWLWRSSARLTPYRQKFARQFVLMQRCMIRSGARPKELCEARWADIQWDWGTTDAGHSYAMILLDSTRWKAGKKTGRSRRIVLSPALTRALRRERAKRPDEGPIFTHGHGRGGEGREGAWRDGSTLSQRVRRYRREAIAECRRRIEAGEPTKGLEQIADEGANSLSNYRWRHTAASTLHAVGLELHDIAEMLGTSVRMLISVYLHITDSHLKEVSSKSMKR